MIKCVPFTRSLAINTSNLKKKTKRKLKENFLIGYIYFTDDLSLYVRYRLYDRFFIVLWPFMTGQEQSSIGNDHDQVTVSYENKSLMMNHLITNIYFKEESSKLSITILKT
jgi:hypothetical protein